MSVSPQVQPPTTDDEERHNSNSPYFPRISGANTIARPSPLQSATHDASGFPTVKLQAKMVKQTPLPYQTQEFKPCIVLKKFEPSVRISDSFVSGVPADDAALGEFKKKRTVILHTDRYSHQGLLKLDSDSQKVRLAQEGQMLQDARSRMRLREALAHRARHDLHLGGNPMAPDQLTRQASDEDIRSTEPGDKAKKRKRLDKHQRRLKKLNHLRSDNQVHLGFIPEEAADSSAAGLAGSLGRRAGQLVTHSSAPSIPALHLGQYRNGGQQTSFVSRSEFDALASLIGEHAAAATGGLASTTSGLEKVKLDGSKAVFNRRSDILAELSRLKAIVLPDFARDLYVGRGIRLPGNHAVNHPRKLIDDDPVLDALMRRAQQPTRIIDESGNILISAGSDRSAATAASETQQIQRGANRQVFAADVTARPRAVEKPTASEQPAVEDTTPLTEAAPAVDPDSHGDNQQQLLLQSAAGIEESLPQLPEPFLGLPSNLNGTDDVGDSEELIKQLQLPQNVTGYLLAVKAASRHSQATFLTMELGRLMRQRLSTGDASVGQSTSSLVDWLRRGLDLFHDVDREVKGSVSTMAFFDILSSMRGQPVEDGESQRIKTACGLSGDSVSKLAFLAILPFLMEIFPKPV